MPTLPNHPQPFLRLSTSNSPPSFASGDYFLLPQYIQPLRSTANTTPRIMSNFQNLVSGIPQLNTAPNRRGMGYTIDQDQYMNHESSGFSFTAIAATPPPSFNHSWGPEPPLNYMHEISVNTSVEPVYPAHHQHSPHAGPTLFASENWQDSDSRIAGPSSYPVDGYGAEILTHTSSGLSIQPVSPGSGGSPSPSSEYQSLYGGSPATPNFVYGALPLDEASQQQILNRPLYSHREQLQFFREALSLPMARHVGPFVPQQMYRPHTNSDRRRYVEEVDLEAPLYFWMENPTECGIPLIDALHSRVKHLRGREELVFEGRGPSISVRLQWPGYRQWSRQIPTKDFRSPPGPITMSKLAKNVAKCVQRFIEANRNHPLEDDTDVRWKVGTRQNEIKLEDLILVSMHHVSMGSWQPHLRLARPSPP